MTVTIKKMKEAILYRPTNLLTILLILLLSGCGNDSSSASAAASADESSEQSSDSDDDDAVSDDDSFYSQDTSAGVDINSGDFSLNTLVSANTRNEDGSGALRQMTLTWDNAFPDNSGVIYSICQKDANAPQNCLQLDSGIDIYSFSTTLASLINAPDNSYFILADNGIEQLTSSEKSIHPGELGRMAGYFKASNTSYGDDFGRPVVISADGLTMAVASVFEDSDATGLNGDQSDSDEFGGAFGAVYIFSSDGNGNWAQTDYVKASNAGQGDYFGYALALSDDGLTLAVGAYGEDSSDSNDQHNDEADYAGAVYIFSNDGSAWAQSAYIKADTPTESSRFGYSVALMDDGTRLVVGAPYYSSETSNQSGAAMIFERSDENWTQVAFLEASNGDDKDRFASDVSLSADGSTIAVASRLEDSAASGINGDSFNNDAEDSGAVYIFALDGSTWSQSAYLKASNAQSEDYFSDAITLNNDGTLLAVGATYEDSNAQGIDGDSSNNDGHGAGAVYIFAYNGSQWSEQAYIKGSNSEGADDAHVSESAFDSSDDYWGDHFGVAVAFNASGTVLAVGSHGEDSGAIGINWDESDDSTSGAGAVYLFAYDSETNLWSQSAYIKASNSQEDDGFGYTLDLSADGNTLVVGAKDESSGATGINGEDSNRDNDEDNDENYSGAVYLY